MRVLRSVRKALGMIIFVIVAALLIRTFVAQTYLVDGESMAPTLHDGDRLLVEKVVYSFSDPARRDVVVFSASDATEGEYDTLVKGVVGIPGYSVGMLEGYPWVNGKQLLEPYLPDPMVGCIQTSTSTVVPPGTVYVLGDNRLHSMDSRTFGPIQIDDIQGRLFTTLF